MRIDIQLDSKREKLKLTTFFLLGELSMRNTDCTTTCPGLKAHCLAQNARNQMNLFSTKDTKQTRWNCSLTCFLLLTWPHSRHITQLLTWTLSYPISDFSPSYGARGSKLRFMMSGLRGIANMNECVNLGKCLFL